MKLELKHLAPYLPYGVEYFNTHEDFIEQKGIINLHSCFDILRYEYIKPILRPLSDLLNEELDFYIDFNTILNEIDSRYLREAIVNKTFYSKDIHYSFEVWNCLLSMHFDVFELIKQGLAIDINTLDK